MRALFVKNKVRFARAERLCAISVPKGLTYVYDLVWSRCMEGDLYT